MNRVVHRMRRRLPRLHRTNTDQHWDVAGQRRCAIPGSVSRHGSTRRGLPLPNRFHGTQSRISPRSGRDRVVACSAADSRRTGREQPAEEVCPQQGRPSGTLYKRRQCVL